MKKLIIASLLTLSFNCWAEDFNLYSGNITGVYYGLGDKICDILDCTPKTSTGSIDNIQKLNKDPNGLAIVQYDVFQANSDQLITINTLYSEAFTLVTKADSDINSFKDLKDKIVNVDSSNSGTYFALEKLIKAYQMDFLNFKETKNISMHKQGVALCNGKIDATLNIIGHPNVNLQATANECKLKIIPINDAIAKQFISQNKAFNLTEIKANIYPFNPENIKTIGVKALLVASKKIDPKLLAQLKNKLNASYDSLKSKSNGLNGIALD
jgi:TRAP transporter TAXI family solute receptor